MWSYKIDYQMIFKYVLSVYVQQKVHIYVGDDEVCDAWQAVFWMNNFEMYLKFPVYVFTWELRQSGTEQTRSYTFERK